MEPIRAVNTLVLLVLGLPAYAQFTDWTPPQNLGPVVNSAFLDSCVAISKNGLSLARLSMWRRRFLGITPAGPQRRLRLEATGASGL